MRTLLREPLLHFAIAGAVLFALQAWRGEGGVDTESIEVSGELVDALADAHTERTGQAPDPATLQAVVDDWALREALYREALALGLDQGDAIVRRRLVQKMQFVLDDLASPADPGDDVLQAWLDEHAERFAVAERVSLRHVFFRDGPNARAEAEASLGAIGAGADPGSLGQAFVHGAALPSRSRDQLARLMGDEFADAVMRLEGGTWQGPITSSQGLHLVLVEGREQTHVPALADVRPQVLSDWTRAQRDDREARALDELRGRYPVRLDDAARARLEAP